MKWIFFYSWFILLGCTDVNPEISYLSGSVPASVAKGDLSGDSVGGSGAWQIHVPATARGFTIAGLCDKRVKSLEWDGGGKDSWMEVEQDPNVVASDIDCSDGNFSFFVLVKVLSANPQTFQLRAKYFAGYLPTTQVEVIVDAPIVLTPTSTPTPTITGLPKEPPIGELPQVAIVSPLFRFYVTNANKKAFVVNGSCSPDGKNVKVSAVGVPSAVGFPSIEAPCSGGFSATFDLSEVREGALTIIAQYSVGGQSSLMQTVEGFKDTVPPIKPSNLLLPQLYDSRMMSPNITWQGSSDVGGSGVAGYFVGVRQFRGVQVSATDNSAAESFHWQKVDNVLTAQVPGTFTPGLTYSVAVKSVDNAGNESAILEGGKWKVNQLTGSATSSPTPTPTATTTPTQTPTTTPTVTPTSTPTPTVTPTTTPILTTNNGVAILNPDSYVVLLQHMDGNLDDITGHGVNQTGLVSYESESSIKKFGTSSAVFSGSGYATVSDGRSFQFDENDFTIEMWAKLFGINTAGTKTLICKWPGSSGPGGNSWLFGMQFSSGAILLGFPFLKFQSYDAISFNAQASPSITDTAWHHLAAVRKGMQFTFFTDGTPGDSTFYSGAIYSDPSDLHIGAAWQGSSFGDFFNGYIDELRITKGIALYTGNFAPPTAAFANPSYGLWNVPNPAYSNYGDYGYTVNNTVAQSKYSSWRSWADAYNKLPTGQKSYVEMMIDTPADNYFIFGLANIRAQTGVYYLGRQGYSTWGKYFGPDEISRPSSTQLASTFIINKAKIYIVGIALDNTRNPAKLWFSVDGVWSNGSPSDSNSTPDFDSLPQQIYYFGYGSNKSVTAPVRILGSPTFSVPSGFTFVH